MAVPPHRINITLDAESAARLSRLAARAHVQEGTLARSLLLTALEGADPDARGVVELLDSVPGWSPASTVRPRPAATRRPDSGRSSAR